MIIDTPGQIEVFTWSASGNIITEALVSIAEQVMYNVKDFPLNCDDPTFPVGNNDGVGFKLSKFYYLVDAQCVQLGDQEITATEP